MKQQIKRLLPIAAFAAVAIGWAMTPHETLEIGASAPDAGVKMKDVSGKMMSLNDLKDKNGLLVIFSCNTCPFVVGRNESEGWEGRYNGIAKEAEFNKIGIVLVNSNAAKRDQGDSFDDMVERAQRKGYESAYVLDEESRLANAFGAKTTPHVYLFDNDMKLVYRGAIDDNNDKTESVEQHYLRDAIHALNAGEKISPNSTKAVGCSIKRVKV